MSVAFEAAAFGWFGAAIGRFTHLGLPAGMGILCLAAPLLQPQLFAFALVRHIVRRHGPLLRALAPAAAWVAAERWLPKLLGDTLGYGLYPAAWLRQAADLGGAAGLSVVLLLANEAIAGALARRADGWRAMARPLAAAALGPLLLAAYGLGAPWWGPPSGGTPLRIGMIQSDIVDYERLRQDRGAYAVVRDVLDTHFAMSYDAVERQHADAVLWSETVYPTPFGHPRSPAGAELDGEILQIVDAARVPFVFGTYDRDAAGEYNAAAFVAPGTGLVGLYRKTHPFPFTEHVPAWLDGPALRRWLPWTGTWLPGDGARVFPLRLADGREIPVLPSICLDDVDPGLALAGARLGAQAILNLSNDSWFTDEPQGARLHLAVAAFRSIETRLPQFRVTANGQSAVIDPTGRVLAGAGMGERTLVVGSQPVRDPPPTLMRAWGDWVGMAATVLLLVLAAAPMLQAGWRLGAAPAPAAPAASRGLPAPVAVLPSAARLACGLLRALGRGNLLWMGVAVLLGLGLQDNELARIRVFAGLVLAPEAAAWLILRAFAARASMEHGVLVFARGARRLEVPLHDIAAVEPWRVPLPAAGASLRLAAGGLWPYRVAHADPVSLARALGLPAGAPGDCGAGEPARAYLEARLAMPVRRLDQPWVKFLLFPILLAIPAFRLHQHIAYGSAWGEYATFGAKAYVQAFAIWVAAWAMGVMLWAAALRAAIEAATIAAAFMRPAQAAPLRRLLERLGLVALYVGLPAWVLWRISGA